MKTTVVGLFPRDDDARRVLSQLVASTLDLDAIRVFHRDLEIQRDLAAEAGLKPDRTVPAGMVAGGLLGAAIGFGWGLAPDLPLAQAGPLFLGAVGLLLGGGAGAVAAARSDSLPVPREQMPELQAAAENGAALVLVRTDSLPTARAIRDLFQAGGSETLAAAEGVATDWEPAGSAVVALGGESAETMADPAAPPDHHAPFVPPWRRLWAGRSRAPAPGALPASVAGGGDGSEAGDWPLGPDAPAALDSAGQGADGVSGATEVGDEAGQPPSGAAVAPWERPPPADAEPARYQPPRPADLAEDSAPRRRRSKAETPAEPPPEPEPPPL